MMRGMLGVLGVVAIPLGYAAPAHGQFLRLLGDINRGPVTSPAISEPTLGEGGGSVAYFAAFDPSQSFEVWRTDGTAGGTMPIGDYAAFRPNILGMAGASIVFESGGVLNASAVPGEVCELLPAVTVSGRNSIDAWLPHARRNDRLFVAVRLAGGGQSQVLSTDGTRAGTVVVHSSTSGPVGITSIAATPSRVFITDTPSPNLQRQLYVTEGTAPATLLRTFLNADGSTATFGWLTAADESAFFLAPNDANRLQVWISDGTFDGTTPVSSFTSSTVLLGALAWNNRPLGAGGRLAFLGPATVSAGGPPTRLWISDGTPGGTNLAAVTQTIFDSSGSPLSPETPRQAITSINGVFAFVVNRTGTPAHAVMVGDGSIAGTATLSTGIADPFEFVGVSRGSGGEPDTAYFIAFTNGLGHQLWRTDGTQAGTFALPSPGAATITTNFRALAMLGQRFVYGVLENGTPNRWSVWITDGSVGGTTQLVGPLIPTPANASSSPNSFTAFGDQVSFVAGSTETGIERFAATSEGSSVVACEESVPGAGSNRPASLIATGARLFFREEGRVIVEGVERSYFVVRATTDPLLAGDIVYEGPVDGLDIGSMAKFGESIVFAGIDTPGNVTSTTLWISDGTAEGTRPIVAPGTGRPTNIVATPTEWNGRVYFYALRQGDAGLSVWSTDGTEAGTRWLGGLLTGLGILSPTFLGTADRLYFTAFDAAQNTRLWSTDGATIGIVDPTVQVSSGSLAALDGRVYFAGQKTGNSEDLWRTTAAGTGVEPAIVVSATGSGSVSGLTRAETAAGPRLFFTASVAGGAEPWVSDGTQQGTGIVTDLWPGALGSSPSGFTAVEGGIAFAARTPMYGQELWFSDGTPEGTRLLADINPGPRSSSPGVVSVRGTVLTLAAARWDVGREPWALLMRACAGDFNADGYVNSGDFFEFLNAFFALDARADINHDATVTSQDFFDFLAALFAGC